MKSTSLPRVSILVPTYNRVEYLKEALDSAAYQTYENYEILVADSSTHEGVYSLVQGYSQKKIRYLRCPPEMNQPEKFSLLAREAEGEWAVFLGDDDVLDLNYLFFVTERVRGWRDASMVHCRKKIISETGRVLWMDPPSKPIMSSAEFLYRLSLPEKKFFKMNISGILFRPSLLLEEHAIYPTYAGWHLDYLLWAVLAGRGTVLFEPRILASIRVHTKSKTSDFERDVDRLLQANLTVKTVMFNLLRRVSSGCRTDEEKKYLKLAEYSLKAYLRRHMRRTFDHGFIRELESNEPYVEERLQRLMMKMKEHRIPFFPSFYVYQCLKWLPQPQRSEILSRLKSYKIRKQCHAHFVLASLNVPRPVVSKNGNGKKERRKKEKESVYA